MTSRPDVPPNLVYDPYDPIIDRDPYPVWKRLRDEAPLYYNEQYDFYALSRYEDVHHGLRNWQDYSSARGTVLELMTPGQIKEGEGGGINLGQMIFTDPPAHDIVRQLVQHRFTPKSVRRYEDRVRSLARLCLDEVQGNNTFDLVDKIARPIPPMMIGHFLGIPERDQEHLGHKVDEMLKYEPGARPDEMSESAKQARGEIIAYMRGMIADRARSPREDVISMLLNSELDLPGESTRKLAVDELISFFLLLQGAGSETSARALGWAGILLSRHPEQRRKLVVDPGKIVGAVEEILRYEAPSPIQARIVTRDVEWYGFTVPAGSKMALLNASANRDERRFENPDSFDIDRRERQHLTFGFGTHTCLGANLARLEMRVVLEELLQRYPDWHVNQDEVELVLTTTVRGPKKVPLQVNL